MNQPKRDFISIRDFSNEEILTLFEVADRMQASLRESYDQLAGYLMGSLFLEPSTRTRLSFEAAMNRLGGRVLTLSDMQGSSISKGESLADSARMVSSYADVIVLRHPQAGAARVAAEHSPVPVINAGDGGHEHPTQTLCDLYALQRLKGTLPGLKVVLYGDLKYGRTTHSLAMALARFGADVLAVAERGLELPTYVRDECEELAGPGAAPFSRNVRILGADSIFGAAEGSGILFSCKSADWNLEGDRLRLDGLSLDAIYVTRLQRERLREGEDSLYSLPHVDTAFLAASPFRDAVVLHPLPRLDEIHPEVDQDPRGAYFQQAAWGVPIRMALLSMLLGRTPEVLAPAPASREETAAEGRCPNPGCVLNDPSCREPVRTRSRRDGERVCGFCDTPFL